MIYSARKLRWNGLFWTCILEWHDGCVCSKMSKEVEIHQVKRPSLEIIKSIAFPKLSIINS